MYLNRFADTTERLDMTGILAQWRRAALAA